MRYRMGDAATTGLGNPEPERLNNQWTGIEEIDQALKPMIEEAINQFFRYWNACDFSIKHNNTEIVVTLGIEPAYQGDKLKIVEVSSCIEGCFQEKGVAFGYYGSKIVSTQKKYVDYRYKTPFTKFAEKWSAELQKIALEYLPIEEE